MIDELSYCTRFGYGVLIFSHVGVIMAKGTKIYGLYILNGSIFIGHVTLSSEELHDKKKI